jgi:hypothetical protein
VGARARRDGRVGRDFETVAAIESAKDAKRKPSHFRLTCSHARLIILDMARDIYHQICKKAVTKNGWNVTHDPLRLTWGGRDMYIDLGAEQLLRLKKVNNSLRLRLKVSWVFLK